MAEYPKKLADGSLVVFKTRSVGMSWPFVKHSVTPSPWFKPNDPPVRVGNYQVQDTAGRISLAWWDGVKFNSPCAPIVCAWRGVVA